MTDGAPGAMWTLRGATLEDVESVADVWHKGWRDGHLGHVPEALLPHRRLEHFRAFREREGAFAPQQGKESKMPDEKLTGHLVLATSYSRTACRRTTIGAAAFHFRVRNGNGWCHYAIVTRVRNRTGGCCRSDASAKPSLWRLRTIQVNRPT